MPRHAYTELHYHVVWHTKKSRAFIARDLEGAVHDAVRRRALGPGGVFVHEIGGTENHIHIAAILPPTLLVSEWIRKVKGGSCHDLNQLPAFDGGLAWQTGYGALTFGTGNVDWVRSYIRDQKRHHSRNTWIERLERAYPLPPAGR